MPVNNNLKPNSSWFSAGGNEKWNITMEILRQNDWDWKMQSSIEKLHNNKYP